MIEESDFTKLNDVATLPPDKAIQLTLEEVGLENVQSQVQMQGLLLPAKGEACVSLIDIHARGIHMSRMFKILSHLHEQELAWPWLTACLEEMLQSQRSLSDGGHLQVAFELPILRRALVSEEQGWRNYPVTYRVAKRDGQLKLTLMLKVLYSSTCPCSASLSRQAIQEKFREDFAGSAATGEPLDIRQIVEWLGKPAAMVAVPHSQRSEAFCEFTVDPDLGSPSALGLIDAIEMALGTPLQTAVKREDEQEFARRNARNLMFCEDAARKLKAMLLLRDDLADFKIEVRHYESLHPHDVVAKAQK